MSAEKPGPTPIVTLGPQRQCPPMAVSWTQIEGSQKRNDYQMPSMIPGEVVYWRPQRDSAEYIAWIRNVIGKSVTLQVHKPGQQNPIIENVYWWDHTLPDPHAQCDPNAFYNPYGSFRLSESGTMLRAFWKNISKLPNLEGLTARVDELEKQAAAIMSSLEAKTKKS